MPQAGSYGRLVTSFVVETFVPADNRERFAVDVDGLRRSAADSTGGQVRHIRSYLVPGDEMGFHLVEAGTVTDVERIARRAGIEPERIVEAVRVDGITGQRKRPVAVEAGPRPPTHESLAREEAP